MQTRKFRRNNIDSLYTFWPHHRPVVTASSRVPKFGTAHDIGPACAAFLFQSCTRLSHCGKYTARRIQHLSCLVVTVVLTRKFCDVGSPNHRISNWSSLIGLRSLPRQPAHNVPLGAHYKHVSSAVMSRQMSSVIVRSLAI